MSAAATTSSSRDRLRPRKRPRPLSSPPSLPSLDGVGAAADHDDVDVVDDGGGDGVVEGGGSDAGGASGGMGMTTRNGYRGHRLERPDESIDVLRYDHVDGNGNDDRKVGATTGGNGSIDSETFFRDYVARRRPCLLDFHPPFGGRDFIAKGITDEEATTDGSRPRRWSITRTVLERVAGDEVVQVERRFHKDESFGKPRTASRQLDMSLRSFLRRVCGRDGDEGGDDEGGEGGGDGCELLYLSTQEQDPPVADGDDDESMPPPTPDDPISSPCRQLVKAGVIPNRLDPAGNLILHACNLWMGRSAGGTSSGLHHDHHDNFYLLIKGRKRFRLYSPDVAGHMETVGEIDRVHPNGRISYVGNEARADGVPVDVLRSSVDGEKGGGEKRSSAGEEQFVNDGFTSNDPHGDDGSGGGDDDIDEDEDVGDEEEVVIGGGYDYESSGGSDWGDQQVDDYDRMQQAEEEDDGEVAADAPPAPADSFSRIDLRRDPVELAAEFPKFARLNECVCEVKAGQCLYLPAGWFHEVTSFGGDSSEDATSGNLGDEGGVLPAGPSDAKGGVSATAVGGRSQRGNPITTSSIAHQGGGDCGEDEDDGLGGCHVAVNYWFHPPDDLTNFQRPYRDGFWRRVTAEADSCSAQRLKRARWSESDGPWDNG